MAVETLLEGLKAILPEDQIESEVAIVHPYGNSGRVVVTPKTEEEIAAVVKFAARNGKKISVMGGGSKRGFGGIKETADLLLSLKNYTGVVEHTVGNMTLTVRSGTTFKELQDYLSQHNQQLSIDPFWPEYSTIGGVIAANDSGPKRLGYGSSRDSVIGLRIVYPDGSIIRSGGKVVKNVAGYDMNKLFVGSMGTLGILTEVTLKLRPSPKYESLSLLSFPNGDIEEIRSFAVQLLDSVLEPVALELLSPNTAEVLTRHKAYTLAISFEDVESSVRYQEEVIKRIQPSKSVLDILQQKEAQEFWNTFYKIGPNGAVLNQDMEQIEAALKIGVKNLDVLDVLNEIEKLNKKEDLTILAHGGLGHGLCQVILKGSSDGVVSIIKSIRDVTTSLGGYAIVKHLPFAFRQTINIWGENPKYFFLLEGIKNKVDPKKVLNEQRFVGGL